MSVIDKASLIEKSRETVEQIMARRGLARTYEEKAQYASDIVDMHLHEENPERIDECIKLYTEDAVWETPARNVTYKGAREHQEDVPSHLQFHGKHHLPPDRALFHARPRV